MSLSDLLSRAMIVPAVLPVADAFAGGINSEAVSLRDFNRATLIIMTGAIEDSGISNLVTVEACTAADGTGNTAMAFRSRRMLYSTTVDTWGALTARTSSGHNFATASGGAVANNVWMLEVTADEVAAAAAGSHFVRAVIAETVNKTITAAGLWILSEPRYAGAIPVSVIA
jgi:hypothetical protein